MNSTKSLMILSVMTVIVVLTSACFITNCPPGGKRSVNSNQETPKKQCTRCGPSGAGRCFGPDICCGPSMGCHIKNRFTTVCSTEDYSPHPCHNEGKVCANGRGVCALESICCASDGCFVDKHCQQIQFKASNEEKIWSNAIETIF